MLFAECVRTFATVTVDAQQWLHRLELELLRTGRTQWRAQRPEERFGMKMFDAHELENLLQRRGFAVESQIGKTCIIQRRHQELLADKDARKRCLQAELSVHHKPHWWALASHLQFAARKLG